MTPGIHWGDDSNIEPPDERTSRIVAMSVVAFVAVICACLVIQEMCA